MQMEAVRRLSMRTEQDKYDASNRLQKEVYRDKIIEYTYDNNGNLLYQETNSTEAAAVFGAVAEVVRNYLRKRRRLTGRRLLTKQWLAASVQQLVA